MQLVPKIPTDLFQQTGGGLWDRRFRLSIFAVSAMQCADLAPATEDVRLAMAFTFSGDSLRSATLSGGSTLQSPSGFRGPIYL